MPTEKIEKILKAINPMNPEILHQRLDAFLRGDLGAEEEEWVRDYLLIDDEALLAFTYQVAEKVDTGEIPLREWPSGLPMPPMELYSVPMTFSDAARQALGTIWEEVKAQGKAWAAEQRETVQRCLQGAMMLWRISFAGAGAHYGKAAPEPTMGGNMDTAAEVVDENWQPQGQVVPFEITEGPLVTKDGYFSYVLHTPEDRWQGNRILCTVPLAEGQRLSFASVVEPAPSGQGGAVRFRAEGLLQRPPGEQDVPIPVDFVRLWLLPSSLEAA
jgi:hypothetical protein